ncbi:MAG: sugar kinase [Rhodothermales bacterium]|nr:sugar kinase [Rhodothermales bacterium]
MSVVAVGTVAFDSIETPFGSVDKILGGSAVYVSLSGRFFYDDFGVVAVVGSDFPTEYIDLLKDRGIDLSGLEVVADGKTFAWAGRYNYDLNDRDTLATHLNVLDGFEPNVPSAYRQHSVVCLGNLAPVVQQSVVAQVATPKYIVLDTMNFWIDNTLEQLVATLKLADCLIINDSEARQLSGEANLIRAARKIRDMGPQTLVIKKGEHGALLFAEDHIFSVPAYPLEDIHDPTGAGDSFMGGFVGSLARSNDFSLDSMKRAVVYGSAVASFCVESFGPERLLEITRADIDRRAEAFRTLSEIPSLAYQLAD